MISDIYHHSKIGVISDIYHLSYHLSLILSPDNTPLVANMEDHGDPEALAEVLAAHSRKEGRGVVNV